MQGGVKMSDTVNDSELGRAKNSVTPSDHLRHLLNIGWSPSSPLVMKYVVDKGLQRELSEWQAIQKGDVKPDPTRA